MNEYLSVCMCVHIYLCMYVCMYVSFLHLCLTAYQPSWVIWLDLVLWHINHYRLFNAKSGLYIYIRYI